MKIIRISPGSMGILSLAMDLFGIERVYPGSWMTPVWARDLTSEEVEFAEEFFKEHRCQVVEETDPGILSRVESFSPEQIKEKPGLFRNVKV